jgi:hypothetical protein
MGKCTGVNQEMKKKTARLVGVGLVLCVFACGISFGILASMNGFFGLFGDMDSSANPNRNVVPHRMDKPEVYANPDVLEFRTNLPAIFADPYILDYRIMTTD